jgi:hypothetical protein
MTEGLCPHCGEWFRSLEIHLGKCRRNDPAVETMRRIQEQQKEGQDKLRDFLKPKKRC